MGDGAGSLYKSAHFDLSHGSLVLKPCRAKCAASCLSTKDWGRRHRCSNIVGAGLEADRNDLVRNQRTSRLLQRLICGSSWRAAFNKELWGVRDHGNCKSGARILQPVLLTDIGSGAAIRAVC